MYGMVQSGNDKVIFIEGRIIMLTKMNVHDFKTLKWNMQWAKRERHGNV